MDNPAENFDSLLRLLKLKRHEVPPPGYFERLARDIRMGVRATRHKPALDPLIRLREEAPWFVRLWETLAARPAFAGFVGASACAVVIAMVALSEKHAPVEGAEALAVSPMNPASLMAVETSQPLRLMASNEVAPPPRNLFEMMPSGQALPAGFTPSGR
jgi:hypothetical protein